MAKKVTFKCSSCGKPHTFQIGANASLTTLQDAIAHIKDPKEADKLLDAYMKVTNQKNDGEMLFFTQNPAAALTNINYDACKNTLPLFDEATVKPVSDALFDAKLSAQIASSQLKWLTALNSDGIVAFEAMYMCPKHRVLTNGVFLQMRWSEDKKERVYQHVNRCEQCGSEMNLVNDQNMGFSFEGLPTLAKCTCGGVMVVETVVFNK